MNGGVAAGDTPPAEHRGPQPNRVHFSCETFPRASIWSFPTEFIGEHMAFLMEIKESKEVEAESLYTRPLDG